MADESGGDVLLSYSAEVRQTSQRQMLMALTAVGAAMVVMLVLLHVTVATVLLGTGAALVGIGVTVLSQRGTTYRLRGTTLVLTGVQTARVQLVDASPVRVSVLDTYLHLEIGSVRIRLGEQGVMPCRFQPESLLALADALGQPEHADARETSEWLRRFAQQPTYESWPVPRGT